MGRFDGDLAGLYTYLVYDSAEHSFNLSIFGCGRDCSRRIVVVHLSWEVGTWLGVLETQEGLVSAPYDKSNMPCVMHVFVSMLSCVRNHGHVTLKPLPAVIPHVLWPRITNRCRVGSSFVLLLDVSDRQFAVVNESEGGMITLVEM